MSATARSARALQSFEVTGLNSGFTVSVARTSHSTSRAAAV
jgi:hypothetical protein